MRSLSISVFLLMAAPVAASDIPRLLVGGPQGCAFFASHSGDNFPEVGKHHMFVDHELMDAPGFGCFFDQAFSLVGARGKVEEVTGACASATDSTEKPATIRLTYSDAKTATLEISGFETPFALVACD